MLTQLQLRVFYSFHENRTPAVIGMVMLIVGVIGYMVVEGDAAARPRSWSASPSLSTW